MTTTRIDSSQQLAACLNLLRTATVLERRMSRQLVHGMALPELLLLTYLRNAPDGVLRRVDLAERLGMSQSSVTRLLGPLERRKIVERVADERDARAVCARLTKSGQEVVDDALASAEVAAEDLFQPLTDKQVTATNDALCALVAGVPGSFRTV
jgi:DNA-binding MarR family transcriptional regulator